MKTVLAFLPAAVIFLSVSGCARSPHPEEAAILQAARDYADGWYEGDSERMDRSLHTDLAKRIVFTNPKTGKSRINHQGKEILVAKTGMGGGKKAPVEIRPSRVTLLDIFENAAVVKVEGPEWVDYLQMARWEGEWLIVNVLWEPLPEHRDRLYKALSVRVM